MKLSQILIKDGDTDNLPGDIQNNINSTKLYFPDFDHTLYTKEMLREFISDNFDKEVLWAFDYLNAYAYKADLARYCLMYINGGLYIDLRIQITRSIDFGNLDFLFFKDLCNSTHRYNNFAVQNGFLYSKAKNVAFLNCINSIVENCKNNYYGLTALDITGPTLLGKKISEQDMNPNGEFGNFLYLTPEKHHKNLAYVTNYGHIVGLKIDNGDITRHLQGVNDYGKMWHYKEIYGNKEFQINYLYNLILNRNVDVEGLKNYMNVRNEEIIHILKNSDEYKQRF